MKILRKAVGQFVGIPTPFFLLKIGAFLIGTEPELVLKSRNVIPKKLLDNGFQFEYNTLENTFKNLLKK
jgi:NAD dependent epimerase/dehydratase family enzyme